jgi:radical SAM protein with 4Fe4S-binding SPASM domain
MHFNKRTNPFKSIYQMCNAGNSKKKLANLPSFPRYIDIELTNSCNFRCLMCPTGNLSQSRKKGFMKDEVYYKIFKNIRQYKTPIRFIRWGEPTMHPKLIHYISTAKQEGILCHINTNGSFLNEDNIAELIDAGLDSIKFSFQGVDRKSYSEMRNIDYYDELIEIMKLFYEIRNDREKPYIHASTTITYEDAKTVCQFKEKLMKFTDLVTVGRTVLEHIDINKTKLGKEELETIRWLKEQESVVKKHPECPEVFDKLSINWDGTVSACCSDYDNKMVIGDIRVQSLEEIWVCEKMTQYREILVNMEHDKLELCKTCYDYYGLQTPGLQNLD